MASPRGVLLVDKPAGITSHGVVARARKALATRKIGHAGTLDPAATGLLLLGVGPATRLLTYVVGLDKTYTATIRLGQATDTDDAEGTVTARAAASALDAVTDDDIARGVGALTGLISQVPSAVSAVKVDGRHAYDRVRAGEDVVLAARDVQVTRFTVGAVRRHDDGIDLDVVVDCSSGTYVRALARDLGAALGVGGHLTALRRTRIGPFSVTDAVTIDEIGHTPLHAPAWAAARVLPTATADAAQATALRHGQRVAGLGDLFSGPRAAVIDPEGRLVGVVERRGPQVASVMNMPEEPAA